MNIVCLVLQLFLFAFLVSIVLSWFPLDPQGVPAQVNRALRRVTDPVLAPMRRVIPPVRAGNMMLDLSPIVVIIGIQILTSILCS